jgi:hypothetical protein
MVIADAYTKAILTVIAVALIALVAQPLLSPSPASGGAVPPGAIPKPVRIEIPKAWGRLSVAAWNGLSPILYFEAADGTIRAASCDGCLIARSN